MTQLKLFVTNSWLESLLKQYFTDIELVIEDIANIKIFFQEKNLVIKTAKKIWFLAKPISILELINIFEQARQILAKQIILIGPISFYPEKKMCNFQEEEIILTQKETEILLYLSKQLHETSKEMLLDAIWGYSNEISTHTLETHIYKLRNKFADKYELILSNDSGYRINNENIIL